MDRIDFEKITPILSDLYENDTNEGGKSIYDPIFMIKILLVQKWYDLSDLKIERQLRDRISVMSFLVILRSCLIEIQYGTSVRGYQKQARIAWYSMP